jgi:cation diffusion facilitator family transporter
VGEKASLFRKGEKAAEASTVVNLVLTILTITVALFSGSVALFADAIDSFADIFSSAVVWVGLRMIQRKPSERFPYGYYRAETLALLIVSAIVIVSGLSVLRGGVNGLFEPSPILYPTVALVVAGSSGLVTYVLSWYKTKIGKSIGSQALIGEGQHSLVDVYMSMIVFIGVLFSSLGYPAVEALAGSAIGLYVIGVGLRFGREAVLGLMDVSPSPQRVKEVKDAVESVEGVKGVHAIKLRKSGPVYFAEMHVELPEDTPLEKAHAVSEEIEESIRERFKDIESVAIHLGGSHKERIKVGIPIVEDKGLESIASPHFGNAPLFAFLEIHEKQIEHSYIKENKAAKLMRKKGLAAAQFLVDEKIDIALLGGIGEAPFHFLRDSLVQLYHIPQRLSVGEAVRLLSEKKLERISAPTESHERDNE